MNPVDFIRKNIASQLASEGFPEQVCQGGELLTIVFSVLVSGLLGRRQQQNARQRKGRREGSTRPAFINLTTVHACINLPGEVNS